MSLQLDARQRAMLKEMGVRVWLPASAAPATTPVASVEPAPEPARAPAAPAAVPDAPRAVPRAATPPPPEPVVAEASPLQVRALPADIAAMDWDALQQAVAACQACELCNSRKNTVFGVGDRRAQWLVVGEAPGEQEDVQGEPFVGASGELLDNMLKAVGLSRQGQGAAGAYIANVLKCRPPANRNPQLQEVLQCEPYLRRQVELLQPKLILALGRFAVQALLHDSGPAVASQPLGKLRGQIHRYQGVPVIVSYHPAYLLRSPQDKAKAWADLCLAREILHGQDGA
ncbi:MAG: uracil-DNA glycosylase [Hylemonella sp.]|nr:uracil-DNA glycosylase [Hylemonella sp.]